MSEITFVVPGLPVAWARTGGNGKFRFTPAKQRNFMAALRTIGAAAMQGERPLSGPVELSVRVAYPWAQSVSTKKRAMPGAQWRTARPDIDNLSKIIADSLNGISWGDDAQVVSLHVWKLHDDFPGLTVRIRSLEV